MKAVHFGAGNIGRGFVGLLLHEGGYEVVFSDVADALVDAINAASEYTVREAGPGGVNRVVTGFRAVNSRLDPDGLADEIATADVVTTAVGPTVLRFVAPAIVEGLRRRSADAAPLQVMACENAIGATDQLRDEVVTAAGADADLSRCRVLHARVHPVVLDHDADHPRDGHHEQESDDQDRYRPFQHGLGPCQMPSGRSGENFRLPRKLIFPGRKSWKSETSPPAGCASSLRVRHSLQTL